MTDRTACTSKSQILEAAQPFPSLLAALGEGFPLVLAHLPLVAPDLLLALPPAVAADTGALLALPLGLHVDLDEPVVLSLLVEALVAPLALPLARLLVVGEVLALLAGLGLDALLLGEALPLCRGLGLGHGLLAGQAGGRGGQAEQDAVAGGGDGAGGEELVDERLGAVPGDVGQGLLFVGGVEDEWVGVFCEEVAEIEGIRRRLFDCDLQLGLGFEGGHCDFSVRRPKGSRGETGNCWWVKVCLRPEDAKVDGDTEDWRQLFLLR